MSPRMLARFCATAVAQMWHVGCDFHWPPAGTTSWPLTLKYTVIEGGRLAVVVHLRMKHHVLDFDL